MYTFRDIPSGDYETIMATLTNEEKRVISYSGGVPTVPRLVNADTPLESLNLNWREKDLREKERTKHVHRLHPYLGKFIPQLVEIFLRKYFKSGQTICDPFVGSGTTLVQANELGINGIGYDVSAFNVLLSQVKTHKYDVVEATKEIMDILGKVKVATQSNGYQLTFWETESILDAIPAVDNKYLHDWFAPKALTELLTYQYLVERGDYEYKDLLRIILSRSARSARLTTHFDLDFPKKPQTEPYWCYKHSRQCKPTTDAFKFLKRYSEDTIPRLREFAVVRSEASVSVFHQDSRAAKVPPIDGVITSPPYVGLIDYHGQHEYAYHLLGLENRDSQEIGSAVKGASQAARAEYQHEIAEVFRNVTASMPHGGRMIIIAGDKYDLYDQIAKQAEMDVEHIVQRHVNRRTGRRTNEFFESVFIWRKP